MKRPIKVLEVLEATVGGTRRHLVSLVTGIDRNKFAIEVAAPEIRESTIDDRGFIDEIQAVGVPLHIIPMVRSIMPIADMKSLRILSSLIRENHYDLVHVHSSKAGFLGRIAAKWNGLPTIYTPNGFYFLNERHLGKRLLFLSFEKMIAGLTDTLIAVSFSEKQVAIQNKIIPKHKIEVIPNGIELNQFYCEPDLRCQLRSKLGLQNHDEVIGIISRYIPQKDPLTVVRCAKHVLDVRPSVKFIWCGEGPMREETEALAQKLGVESSFMFLGYRADVVQLMNVFDVLLLASIFEGLPYTILESMATKLPIVATNAVGTRDLIKDGESGFLSPKGDAEGLAQNILKLLQDSSLRHQLGERARVLVEEKYNVSRMITETENIYLKTIGYKLRV